MGLNETLDENLLDTVLKTPFSELWPLDIDEPEEGCNCDLCAGLEDPEDCDCDLCHAADLLEEAADRLEEADEYINVLTAKLEDNVAAAHTMALALEYIKDAPSSDAGFFIADFVTSRLVYRV